METANGSLEQISLNAIPFEDNCDKFGANTYLQAYSHEYVPILVQTI